MTQISKNFTLESVEHSDTANRMKIANKANAVAIAEACALAANVLEPVAAHFGKPVQINSWFRCEALERILARTGYLQWLNAQHLTDTDANWSKYFVNKQHPKGQAADIVVPGVPLKDVFDFIKNNLKFDQLLLENKTWIHVSFRRDGVLRNMSNGEFKA